MNNDKSKDTEKKDVEKNTKDVEKKESERLGQDPTKVPSSEATIKDLNKGARINTPVAGPPQTDNIHRDTTLEHPASSDATRGPIGQEPANNPVTGLKEPSENIKARIAEMDRMNKERQARENKTVTKDSPPSSSSSSSLKGTTVTASAEEEELTAIEDMESERSQIVERKMGRIAQILRESGADSMSQVKAMEKIREIL